MNWNWGKGIVVSFVLFGTFILYMVFRMFQQNIDLVDEKYYDKEIAFDTLMNKSKNVLTDSQNVFINWSAEGLSIRFQDTISVKSGSVLIYRPSDKSMDFTMPLINKNSFVYSDKRFKNGLYSVKLEWVIDNKKYYKEESIFVD
jgi:hypothetical protein